MSSILLHKGRNVPNARICLPASKSLSNRLLILSRLSEGRISPKGISEAGDSKILQRAIRDLDGGNERLDLADAGTAMRFMTALAALVPGERVLTGTERMKERPIGPLVEALREIGGDLAYLEKEGYPPLRIKGRILKGGKVGVRSDISSQFLSALVLIAPFTEEGITIRTEGEGVSSSYFRMTLELLQDLKGRVEEGDGEVRLLPSVFPEQRVQVEGDHSSAAFWYQYLALSGKGAIFLKGLASESLQGDRELPRYFRDLGVMDRWEGEGCWIEAVPGQAREVPYEADMRDHPDLVPPLVVTLAALGIKAHLTGIANLRHKESDRLEALRLELAKVGVRILVEGERLGVDPSNFDPASTPRFESHDDHRIAMALAPFAAILPELRIGDPEVVEKSYPHFWQDLERIDPTLFPPGQNEPRS